jgi:hypothetical protein
VSGHPVWRPIAGDLVGLLLRASLEFDAVLASGLAFAVQHFGDAADVAHADHFGNFVQRHLGGVRQPADFAAHLCGDLGRVSWSPAYRAEIGVCGSTVRRLGKRCCQPNNSEITPKPDMRRTCQN